MPKKKSHLITVDGASYRWMAWRNDLNVELDDTRGQRLIVRLLRDKHDPWLEISSSDRLKSERKPGEMGEIKKQFVQRAIKACIKLGWKPDVCSKPIVTQFREGRFSLTEPVAKE